MAKYSGEELDWLNKLETASQLLKADPDLKGVQLAKKLECSPAHASYISSLNDCLDQAAIDKVRQAAKGDPPFILSFNSARALIGLSGKVDNPTAAAHTALDTTLSRRLKTNQIEALVESLVKGDNPEEKLAQGLPTVPEDLKKVLELSKKVEAEIARGDGQTTYQDELRALLKKGTAESEENEDSGKKGKAGKKSKSASQNNPSPFWEWVLGVKFMSQLKSKAKKGQLTANDKILILVDKGLVKPVSWVFKNLGGLLKKLAIGLWHAVEEAAGQTVKKILAVVLPLLFICLLIWAVLAFFHFAVISPLHWAEHKITSMFHHTDTTPEPTPIPTTPSSVSAVSPAEKAFSHLTPKKKLKKTTPTVSYQPAISFQPTHEDPKMLELEIAALSDKVVVKDYPMTPDETMPGDVALSRMQDVADPDKYTMMIGGSKQIIQSVNATNTTLTVAYKSTDPLDLLGGSKSPMTFLWEDARYIHINEIDHFSRPGAPPDMKYDCNLIVKGAKLPLTFQCASTDDLENLVSTMEYFIRHSRLAHDAQPAGMPYPTQGLVLNNDCVVEKLWAHSPLANAGLHLGEVIWSVDKNAYYPPDPKKLQAALAGLTPGSHDLFVVSPSDWDKAQSDLNFHRASSLNPRRRKITLNLI